MSPVTLTLDGELVELLSETDQPAQRVARECVVLELYQRQTISSGTAARLLGMTRLELIRWSGEVGIPLVRHSDQGLDDELAAAKTPEN